MSQPAAVQASPVPDVAEGPLTIEEKALVRESFARIEPAIDLVVHGTTIALNTVIQRKGAKLGLVVSKGNRDVFEIARCRMPNSYNFFLSKEVPLVERDRVFEIDARMLADGSIRRRWSAMSCAMRWFPARRRCSAPSK